MQMKLEISDGKVVWVKNDGSVSLKPVSSRLILAFFNFPLPIYSQSIKILSGDPMKDNIVFVKEATNNKFGRFLLCKLTDEVVSINLSNQGYVDDVLLNCQIMNSAIRNYIEVLQDNERISVNLKALSEIKGLAVWINQFFSGYWCKESGEFYDLPSEWDIYPKGDSAVTTKIRKGPHWIILSKLGKYSKTIGTAAPRKNIQKAFDELGGETGFQKRLQGKVGGVKKREGLKNERLKAAILVIFPKIPEADVQNIMSRATSLGAVGNAAWLYFVKAELMDIYFKNAAYLAVQAHIRHNYTAYDFMLADGQDREEARKIIRGDIEQVISSWK
jgi:hypothetical protein